MNAELSRLLWINLRWQRLLFVPTIAGLLVYLVHATADEPDDIKRYLLPFFYLCTGVWGCVSLFQSLSKDVRDRTLYWQIMLPVTPWQLTWSKLVGNLLFPWMGGIILIFPLLLADPGHRIHIFIILLIQCLQMLFTLSILARRTGNATADYLAFALTLLATVPLSGFVGALNNGDSKSGNGDWYGIAIDNPALFLSLSLLAHVAWALVGCWQAMIGVKQHTRTTSLWPAFLIFEVAYFLGFLHSGTSVIPSPIDNDLPITRLMATLLIILFYFYVAAWIGNTQSPHWRPFIDAIIRRDGKSVWQNIPLYLIILPALPLLLVALAAIKGADASKIGGIITLFALRDVTLLLLISFRSKNELARGTTLFILVVLYLILPWFLEVTELASPALLVPTLTAEGLESLNPSLISVSLQFLLVAFLFHRIHLSDYIKTIARQSRP